MYLWQLHILGCLHCASCPLSDPEGSSSLAVGNLVRTWFTAVGCSPSALGASRRHMEPSLAPLMVARSWSPSRPPSGAQQHQLVRPDDSYLLYRTDAAAQLAQHSPRTPHPSSLEPPPRDGPRDYLHELLVGGGTRDRLLGFAKYILRIISQSLNLRLLAAEAARHFLLPALDAASAPLTTSSPLEVVSRASEARGQVDSQAVKHHALTAYTAQTHHRQPTPAEHGAKQPRRRGTRGSGACRKAGQPLAEHHPHPPS